MFLKRLAAIVITLLLIAQLTACNKESNSIPSNSSQQAINSQTTSKEDGFSQNNSQTGAPSVDNSHQDSDRDETSSDNNQNTDNSGQSGNVTGGGAYSSSTNANPTPYVKTAYKSFVLQ